MARRGMRSDWGSVQEAGRGRWRIRYWAETPDGYRRCSETVRGTRRDANDRLAELRLEHGHDAPCPTVGEVWRRWYRPMRQRMCDDGELSPQTLATQDSSWWLHVAPTWGDVPCDGVRPLAVQQWLLTLTRAQASHARMALSSVLSCAVRYEFVGSNPMRNSYVMPSRSTSGGRDKGHWDADELGAVWNVVRGGWFEAAFLLMAFGSCRVGESLGVRDGDLEAYGHAGVPCAIVDVTRQVRGTGGVTDTLKNQQSRRVVVVPGPMGERLLDIREGPSSPWLTGDGLGGPTTQHALKASWSRMLARLPPDIGRHAPSSLRRSWETIARWTLRLPPWASETLMGHVPVSGGAVTAQHYDQPGATQLADMVCEAYAEHPYGDAWA